MQPQFVTGPSELWLEPDQPRMSPLLQNLMLGALQSEARLGQTLSGSVKGYSIDRDRRWVEDKDGTQDCDHQHKREGMREITKDWEQREEIKANR